ncbi:hypothetical protein J6X96_08635 [bacterium]|nr:hypothetical protein [bacterium]
MNKLIIILFLIFLMSPIVFAENIPDNPDIGGPSTVHVNAENVRYFLKNFTSSFNSAIWIMENTDTQVCITNYTTTSYTFFDMPIDPTTLLIDVGVFYTDEHGYESECWYGMVVEVVRAHLYPVTREGIDITYNGSDANVPIHFNVNHDGGDLYHDYNNIHPMNNDDDDLLYLNMGIDCPGVNFSGCTLEIEISGISAKLWTNKRKTQASYNNNRKFTLIDNDIHNLGNYNFYVEACNYGTFHINVKINGHKIHMGNMRYDAYAVTVGNQPHAGDYIDGLKSCEWSYLNGVLGTSNITSSLAWIVDPSGSRFGHPFIVTPIRPRVSFPGLLVYSNYYGVPAYYTTVDAFGDNNDVFTINDVLAFFQTGIWTSTFTPSSSADTIIYYNGFHAARKYGNGSCPGARGTWRLYMSKHPARIVVLHRDDQLNMGSITLKFNETVPLP